MSNETLTKSIEVLADGKIKAITTNNCASVFLQPVIVVDSKAATERIEVKGSDKTQVRVSVDITSIDGTPFAGDFAALEVALREVAKKANGLRVGGFSGGGGTGGDASIAKQDEQIVIADNIKNLNNSISTSTAETNEKLEAKKFGYILDIQGEGDPPPYEDITDFTQEINGVSISYLTVAAKAATTKELAQLFNTLQTDIYYAALSESELYFIPVSSDFSAINSISFEDGGAGTFTFSTFGETSDTQTGALHQLVPLAQTQSTILRAAEEIQKKVLEELKAINGSKNHPFTINNGLTPVTYPTAGTEYLVFLFKLKVGAEKLFIDTFETLLDVSTNDKYILRIAMLNTFNFAFSSANFAPVDASSQLEYAQPDLLGVPALVEITGFDPGGRDATFEYGLGRFRETFETRNQLPLLEGVHTISVTIQPRTPSLRANAAVNWSEQVQL